MPYQFFISVTLLLELIYPSPNHIGVDFDLTRIHFSLF